jgi:hypothetical protein
MKRFELHRRYDVLLLIIAAAAAALVTVVGSAFAHHGFGGRYNLAEPVWIEGIVREAYFGQPHAELLIEVPAELSLPQDAPDLASAASFLDAAALTVLPETMGQTVEVELPPTQQYFSLGDRVAIGDRIAVVAVRNCEPPHQLNGQWLRLADGEVVARSGAMSYMVEDC